MTDHTSYDIWAMRINDRIRTRKNTEETGVAGGPPQLKGLLLQFAAEAADIAGAIGRNIDDVEILGGDRYDSMEGFLDQMLKFDEFVFLEYRYKIPGKKEPGLRFKFEIEEGNARISVHYFEDLIFWEVDEAGNRIFQEPIRFYPTGRTIRALPSPDWAPIFSKCTSWQAALRETLALPFRFLYD